MQLEFSKVIVSVYSEKTEPIMWRSIDDVIGAGTMTCHCDIVTCVYTVQVVGIV